MSWLGFLPDISLPDHIDINIISIGDEVGGDLVEGDQVDGDRIDGDQFDAEYAIQSEGDIIPINEIDRIVPGKLSGDAPLELSEDNKELVIDPENLEEESEWENVIKPGLKNGWEKEKTVSTRSAYPILIQAERSVSDEKIQEIRQFFSGKIFTSDYQLLQSSLVIDLAMNSDDGKGLSDDELKRRKRNLADKYHDAAFSLPSMCTSGYFDEDELFQEVYREMERDGEYDVDDYDSVFRTMIVHKPFVAYAQDAQSAEELSDIVKGKLSRLHNYDIPFPYIDIRGIGRSNHQKIRDVMESIEEEYETIRYDERLGDRELIVRIDADSIPDES